MLSNFDQPLDANKLAHVNTQQLDSKQKCKQNKNKDSNNALAVHENDLVVKNGPVPISRSSSSLSSTQMNIANEGYTIGTLKSLVGGSEASDKTANNKIQRTFSEIFILPSNAPFDASSNKVVQKWSTNGNVYVGMMSSSTIKNSVSIATVSNNQDDFSSKQVLHTK